METSLVKNIPYVAAAYIGIWVIAFAYLIYLGRTMIGLSKQVKLLNETIKKEK
ncbi:MAG TPA: CcmD family protein [Actinobacteria bacterium]|nr:CcmD family protein [Actinomycetes bacterium]HEX21644.1 CcmD family protein [Actinomycetota bacterium]